MPPMSPRMPPEAPRHELASLTMLVSIDQHGFETKSSRPKACNHMRGQEGMQPMSARMLPRGGEPPAAHRRQHLLEALGR